ncbi:MAG: WhiB family transcriptional regulator, partial [Pseudooceanicola sp.]|nr:WhiB family transcriptional regulator [Pseudooceanicola sp.]
DPELFFPVGNTGPAVDQIEKAKAVCATCTVTEICLQYALESGQDSGVWGGLSEDERRALKRRAARARRAGPGAAARDRGRSNADNRPTRHGRSGPRQRPARRAAATGRAHDRRPVGNHACIA